MSAAPAAKPGLAVILGGLKKPAKGGGAEPADETDSAPEGEEGMPPDFETAAGEAFPELKGDPEKMAAFHRACMACMGG